MEKIRYRLVYNRQKKLNKQRMALVQVEAYLNRRKSYFTTNVYIHPEHWDTGTAQVVNHPQSKELNAMLFEFTLKLQKIELSYWKRGTQATLALLKSAMKRDDSPDITFMRFARQSIEGSGKSEATKENLRSTLTTLRKFRPTIDFKDLTYSFLKDFERHLREDGRHVNTIAKHMRQLRTLINEAINSGYMTQDDYPFKKYRIKEVRGKHTFLTPDELKRLERLALEDGSAQHVLDAYLFCCYTGLRFSDFRGMRESHIVRIHGKRWLAMKSKKTDVEVKLPLHLLFEGKALALLDKYKDTCSFTGIGGNPEVNRRLRGIALSAKIGKRVTFHSARHTNAVLLLHQGVPVTTVQKLLGHTDIKTTQVYAEAMPDTIVRDLKNTRRKRVR